MNVVDVEDAYLAANAEVEVMFAEVMADFYRPMAQIMVSMAAANLKPQQVRAIPEGGVQRIIDFATKYRR